MQLGKLYYVYSLRSWSLPFSGSERRCDSLVYCLHLISEERIAPGLLLHTRNKSVQSQGPDKHKTGGVLYLVQESGGTVLSTNWKEIGAKKVECSPPDSMIAKKYEQ